MLQLVAIADGGAVLGFACLGVISARLMLFMGGISGKGKEIGLGSDVIKEQRSSRMPASGSIQELQQDCLPC
eukprot:1139688-Pelagomonas_calceolata.AAC.2